MLKELTNTKTYIVCGYTDMRRSIDGLAAIVKQNYGLEPCSGSLFLFCGKRRERMKALLWEGLSAVFCYPNIFVEQGLMLMIKPCSFKKICG